MDCGQVLSFDNGTFWHKVAILFCYISYHIELLISRFEPPPGRVASISVEAGHSSVTLKYGSGSYAEDWSDVEQRVIIEWTPCRFRGARPWFVCSVQSNGVCTAVDGSPSSTVLGACSRAATVIGLHTRASRNRPVTEGFGNRRKSEFDWVAARSCWIFRTSRKVCTGGHMTVRAAFMMLLKSAQSSARCTLSNGWADDHLDAPEAD
jgi:hypothetical protein